MKGNSEIYRDPGYNLTAYASFDIVRVGQM